ncbi:BTAD domain-containing putative transcriptional regulator [Bacillota bacterium]
MLTISMLGQMNISYKDVSITDKLSTKLMALVCLLILNSNREMSRERLSAYLWPDSDEESARYNMRYSLWKTKKLIPPDEEGQSFLIITKDSCRINKNYKFQCDKLCIDSFDSHGRKPVEKLLQLKELFKGDFLEGFYLKNCTEFNEIILFERVVSQTKQIEIMKRLANLYDETDQSEEELQILHEMAAMEPYNENFAFRILNIYKKTGNRGGAINYYREFEAKLRRELNIAPNNDLKLLYNEIKEDPGKAAVNTPSRVITEKKELEIKSRCMEGIEYFWVADLIGALLKNTDQKYLMELNYNYILDLSYIQNELLLSYEKYVSKEHRDIGPVPSVRIVNAFINFLSHASAIYIINVHIANPKDMDAASLSVLKYIETCAPGTIRICDKGDLP